MFQNPPTPINQDAQVAPILKAHEDSLISQVPSFLKEAMPAPASPVFNDYVKTGDPVLKQQAASHLSALTSFVHNAVGTITGSSEYTRPTSNVGDITPSILDTVRGLERAQPNAIVRNKDGTTDYGEMQINSSMIPFVKKEFAKQNRPFNPFDSNDSRDAASLILQDNSQRFKKAVGRPPNDEELISSYNVGVTNAIKQAKEKMQGKEADKYVKASIFHGE